MTPQGEGKVIEVFPLRDAILVDIPEVGRREYKREQLISEDSAPAAAEVTESSPETETDVEEKDLLALVSGSEKYAEPEKKEKAAKPVRPERKNRQDRPDRPDRKERLDRDVRVERPDRQQQERRERPGKQTRSRESRG